MQFPDKVIASLTKKDENYIKTMRKTHDILPIYSIVDACAKKGKAQTPYFYSSFETKAKNKADYNPRPSVIIIGSGLLELAKVLSLTIVVYHSVWAAHEAGYRTIIINNNPETVSTDFNTADRLYFEPLFIEDVMAVIEQEKPIGVIVPVWRSDCY